MYALHLSREQIKKYYKLEFTVFTYNQVKFVRNAISEIIYLKY